MSLFQQKNIAGTILKNGFIKTATYEGMYKDGMPTDDLTAHHAALAKGGIALTTVSYGAVAPEGRTFANQMYLNKESLAKLEELTAAVHKNGGKASIQLTHCGYFSKNKSIKKPLAPSRIFNEYGCLVGLPFSKAMDHQDLQKCKGDFVQAAVGAKEAGFDAVELHMGHGYLLSQFLSPATNKRKDDYGGSVQGRSKFPLEVFEAVKVAVGKDFPVLVKINLSDGFKGGFTLEDCVFVCKELENLGCDGIVMSGGFTSKTPFYLMRGDIPLKGMIENAKDFMEKLTMRLFAPLIIKKYEFTPNFFLEQAKEVRSAVNAPLVYLGGVDSMEGIRKIEKEGFDFVAIGRPVIHNPNFIKDLEAGKVEKSGCTRCNECVVEMDRGGVRCTIED